MNEAIPYIALGIAFLTFTFTAVEKLFGGGNALAAKFHSLDKETVAATSLLRTEMNNKIDGVRVELSNRIDEYEKVGTVGFEAIKANIHAMQIGLLEFRASMAESLHSYIRKDDYNTGISDIRRDMHDGFRRVDVRLGEIQDLVMYTNPEVARRAGEKHPPNPR